VLALTVDRSGFTKLLGAEPTLAQTLLRTLATRLRAAETSI
jgi:CRP-like cAMP-binding protein